MSLVLHRLTAGALLAFEVLACLTSVSVLVVLAAGPLYVNLLPLQPEPWQWAAAFIAACLLAVAASWTKGIFDKRLPARFGGEPRHAHISGWTFIWIVLATSVVVALASWAATSDANKATIRSDWGEAILYAVAIAFAVAALIPTMNLAERASGVVEWIGNIIAPFGRMLSMLDSILVFAVAGAAGATQPITLVRYAALVGTLGACATMGYWLQPPWGLVPLAWGFVAAVAISRRWAWVETDRELAMLNRRFSGKHLRIGFAQDLRDESLLAFMSLLFLAPMALRQAQLAALDANFELFNVDREGAQSIRIWIGFFGTELAKALPFVDWAEVYDVGGGEDGIIHSEISQHFVFGLRILVDFVFIAALLQALSISARNATQRGLFYEGQLDRLDPFLEPREFRKLLRRNKSGVLEPDSELVRKFPPYDPIRLSELAGESKDKTVRMIANVVRMQQGGAHVAEFHEELVRRALAPDRDKNAILEVVHAIRAAGAERLVRELDQLRRKLNRAPRLMEVRTEIVRLLMEAPDSQERTDALMAVLDEDRDTLQPARVAALRGVTQAAARGDLTAIAALAHAQSAPKLSGGERRHAREFLRRLDRNGPPPAPAPLPPTPEAAQMQAPARPPHQFAPQPVTAVNAGSAAESEVAADDTQQVADADEPHARASKRRASSPVGPVLAVIALTALAAAGLLFWRQLAPRAASEVIAIPPADATLPAPPPPQSLAPPPLQRH